MKHFSHQELTCDVLVAGGGAAGVPCALAAARQGARVILCQDRPVLGGNASSEVRMHMVGANSGRPSRALELEARESGIIEEIRLENAMRNPQRSSSMFDLILYEKCRAEPHLTLLLNTSVVGARVSDEPRDGKRTLTSVEALRPSTEDRFTISAQVFVDCTGDGGLGAVAGAAYFQGRESRAQFHEAGARESADAKTLGSTLLFMAQKHERPMPFIAPPWARTFSRADLQRRLDFEGGIGRNLEYGFWWLEWGGHLNTIKDNEVIRDELLAILMGVWDFLKNSSGHALENWALDWFGFLPGKRESRRFIGQHVLTETDVLASRPFPDAIAFGGWPIDTHPPEGVDRPEEPPCVQAMVPRLYDVPLGACIARDFSNLLFAGRNLSATHLAFASTRVMATCAVVGQGVGTAAAYAAKRGLSPSRLPSEPEHMRNIRQSLLRQDAYVIGESLDDGRDLVHQATITASSELPHGRSANIRSGQTRCVQGERGVPPERQEPGTHRWMSDPEAAFPQWVQLDWDQPVGMAEVTAVFDTGLHRHLTLTQSDFYSRSMYWGGGQPETVRHFRIEVRRENDTERHLVTECPNNWQRLFVHRLERPLVVRSLRLTVFSTWQDSPKPAGLLPDNELFAGTDVSAGPGGARVMRLSVHGPESPMD